MLKISARNCPRITPGASGMGLSPGRAKAFIREFFSYTIIFVHNGKSVLTIGNHKPIAIIPAARIDPAETGDGNYA
jgi:hypothetical protein